MNTTISLLCLNVCEYSKDDPKYQAQQQMITSSPASATQSYALLPPVNGETYSTALINFPQLPQQQQLITVVEQVLVAPVVVWSRALVVCRVESFLT